MWISLAAQSVNKLFNAEEALASILCYVVRSLLSEPRVATNVSTSMKPLASVSVFVNAAANTELKSMCRATLTALVIVKDISNDHDS